MVGEGGTVAFNPSPDIIHDQKTIYGSWVTSTWLMEELVERLVRWDLHPEDIVTHRFPLERADEAYRMMASGRCGKVAVCPVRNSAMHTAPAEQTSNAVFNGTSASTSRKDRLLSCDGIVLSLGHPQQPE